MKPLELAIPERHQHVRGHPDRAEVAALWRHFTVEPGLGALPRGGSPAVWMIDDDLEFSRLEVEGDGLALRPADDVLETAASLRWAHPEVSVLIGGTTGCPPVPGFTMLAAQVVDLAAHVEQAAASSPGARYVPTRRDRARADYHYDLSDHGPAYLEAFSWEAIDGARLDTRAAFLAHLRAVPGLAWGMPCTRLLVHDSAALLVALVLFVLGVARARPQLRRLAATTSPRWSRISAAPPRRSATCHRVCSAAGPRRTRGSCTSPAPTSTTSATSTATRRTPGRQRRPGRP